MKGVDHLDSTTVDVPSEPSLMPNDDCNEFIKGLRIGISEDYKCDQMSSEVIDCVQEVTASLANSGALVKNVRFLFCLV